MRHREGEEQHEHCCFHDLSIPSTHGMSIPGTHGLSTPKLTALASLAPMA